MFRSRAVAGFVVCLQFILFASIFYPGSAALRASAMTVEGTITDSNGAPIKDAQVMLWRRTASGWEFANQYVSTTDAGTFVLLVPTAGVYTLEFADPSGVHFGAFYNNQPSIETATPITFTGGQTLSVTGVLSRSGAISGRVVDALHPETPIHTVTVFIWRAQGTGWEQVRQGITNDQGEYTIWGLHTGVYRVQFVPNTPLAHFGAYLPSASSLEEAQDVAVTEGAITEAIEVALVPVARLQGSITPPAGETSVGYFVCLVATTVAVDPWTYAPTTCLEQRTTDSNGAYSIGALHAGDYLLYFSDANVPARAASGWYVGAGALASTVGQAQPIELVAGETNTVAAVQLEPASSIWGAVTQTGGTPAAEAEVRIYRWDAPLWRWYHTARTNANGQFTYFIPRIGVYTAGIFTDDTAPRYHAGTDTFPGASVSAVPTDTAHVQLVEQVKASGNIAGRVVHEDGTAAEAEVHAFLSDNNPAEGHNRRAPEWLRTVRTDAQGDFLLTGLGDEDVWLVARAAPEDVDTWWPGTALFSEAEAVRANSGTLALEHALILQSSVPTPAPSIHGEGIVYDAKTGAPVANAVVRLYTLPGWRARVRANDIAAATCPSAASTNASMGTEPTAQLDAGMRAFAGVGEFTPDANPLLADTEGHFGWELTPGCWYVHASAPGYADALSPLWGVTGDKDGSPAWQIALVPLPSTPTPVPPATPTTPPASPPAATATSTRTPAPTVTPASTPTATPTKTALPAASATPATTPTFTPIPVNPQDPTQTATATATPTSTATPISVFVYGVLFADADGDGVQGADEAGIEGATIELVLTDGLSEAENAGSAPEAWRQSTTTSSAGGYAFSGVPVGIYEIVITPPEGTLMRSPRRLSAVIDGSRPAAPLPIAAIAAKGYGLLPLVRR